MAQSTTKWEFRVTVVHMPILFAHDFIIVDADMHKLLSIQQVVSVSILDPK